VTLSHVTHKGSGIPIVTNGNFTSATIPIIFRSNAPSLCVYGCNSQEIEPLGDVQPTNGDINDYFGDTAVSISGDTIVVGAIGEDSNATGVNGDQSI
jgi:hypothetical protein